MERRRTAERGRETEREGLNVGEKESVVLRSNFERLPSSDNCSMFRVGEKNAEPHVVITAAEQWDVCDKIWNSSDAVFILPSVKSWTCTTTER